MERGIHTPDYAIIHCGGNLEGRVGDVNDLEVIRSAVRGHIEVVPLHPQAPIFAWCNEEGKLNGMTPNLPATHVLRDWGFGGDVYYGPVMVTGPAKGEVTTPLSDDAWQVLNDLCGAYAQAQAFTGTGREVEAPDPADRHLEAAYEERTVGE